MASLLSNVSSYLPLNKTGTTLIISLAATVSVYTLIRLLSKKRIVKKNAATVTKLQLYPIKSVPGLVVDSFQVTPNCVIYKGIYDRSMVLLNHEDRMITLRQHGKLALIRTTHTGHLQLTLSADQMPDLVVNINYSVPGEKIRFKVWGSQTEGVELSKEVSEWFSKYIEEPAKLVILTNDSVKCPTEVATKSGTIKSYKYKMNYQDGSPVHICNLATLKELNKVAAQSGKNFEMLAFRPNITVDSPTAYEELSWYSCIINSLEYLNVRACTRCLIPTIDFSSGDRDPDKKDVMRQHRKAENEFERKNYSDSPLFGINTAPLGHSIVKLGDSVDVCV